MSRGRKVNYKRLFKILFSAGFAVGGLLLMWFATLPIPDLGSFDNRVVSQSTKIYDKTGEVLLYDTNKNVTRTVISFDEMSRNIRNATVAIEDSEFYEHSGVRPLSFLRAVLANLRTGTFGQGGSTITQQVVKNTLLTKDKAISRKIKEWLLSIKLEKVITKDKILEAYLNEAPYGGSIYGIEEASQSFFGKSALELTLAESAYLAALPQAPTFYSPYGIHRDRLEVRKNLVLEKMLENSFITKDEYDTATKEEIVFKQRNTGSLKAPHFVFFVIDYLQQKYGVKALEENGFKVITTLDYELQEKAEAIVKEYALRNEKNFNAENAAMVAIDPKTGGIITMVGSRNYFDEEIDGNFNVAIAHRQPGSSFKPFVYAAAFNKGYTPQTVLFDVKTEFSTNCSADSRPLTPAAVCYSPENYDGHFKGPLRLEQALAESRNIPSVKLLYLVGVNNALKLARDMGIRSLEGKDVYGLTLVLGGGEVSLLDMTSGYGVFANSGVRTPYQSIIRIEDSSGNVIEEPKQESREVLSKQTALKINQILSSDELRSPEFGLGSYLHFSGRDVADKTDTTNDYKDAWILGYTPDVAVGAWAGNNDNTPMVKKIAGFIVAPMWNAFMQEVLKKYPDNKFEKPDPEIDASLKPVLRGIWRGNVTSVIDTRTGLSANENTPPEFRQENYSGQVHSILYWLDKDNPRGAIPTNPGNDPQFRLWEPPVLNWARNQGYQ